MKYTMTERLVPVGKGVTLRGGPRYIKGNGILKYGEVRKNKLKENRTGTELTVTEHRM